MSNQDINLRGQKMKMGRFLVIAILSAFIICLPFKVLAANDSEDDPLEFDRSGYYKDVRLTVGTGMPLELLPGNLNDAGNIGISLNPERPVFSAGDFLSFTASVDRDCYLTVMCVSESGKVIVLWPNRESGLNSTARTGVPIRIPARESRFQLQVDGKQPYETIVAYASTGRKNVLDEDHLSDIPATAFRTFNGTPAGLADIFQNQVETIANREAWGTAQLNMRIGSAGEALGQSEADSKAEEKPFGPVAIKARGGGYLSVDKGKISFVKKITPSAIFHLQTAPGDQVKVVGRNGTINEPFGFRSNMFIFAPRIKKTGLSDRGEKESTADTPRRSQAPIFLLVPVKLKQPGKKDMLDDDEIETKGSLFEQDLTRN
ncbi:MAG: DUF4384 domain-containing protein [Desulfomonilaceae bacterium]